MNELQIRLTADIKDLQSAINKAKATLKSFESETAADSEKSNVGFKRKLGLIEEQIQKAKQLKIALTQATSKEQIAGFNAELEKTNQKLAELNALGKTVTAPAVRSFDNLKRAQGAASSAAISFGRIIQDAPFGIIGVANNIQNFGEQFVALGGKSATAGQKLSQFFSALITPSNLAILAVSALTAAYQAYTLGLFDSEEQTKDLRTESEKLNDSLDNLVNSLNSVDSARLQGNKGSAEELIQLELLNSILNDTTKSESDRLRAYNLLLDKYPKIIGNISEEKALAEGLGDAYLTIVRAINQRAAAIAIEDKLVELLKQKFDLEQKVIKETQLQNQLLKQRDALLKQINDRGVQANENATTLADVFGEQRVDFELVKIGEQLVKVNQDFQLLGNVVAVQTENALSTNSQSVQLLTSQYYELSQSLIALLDPLDKVQKRTVEVIPDIKLDRPDVTGLGVKLPELDIRGNQGFIEEIQKRIEAITLLKDASRDLGEISNFNVQLEALQQRLAELNGDQVTENINLIVDAFSSLGAGIAASLNISDRALRGFVTTLLSATPKIIGAIIQQAAARKAEAAAANVANAQVATGNAVVVATEGAKGLGPVGLALLPVFIAGAVALVSAAFSKTGGGGGVPSAGTGSTFTNRREFGGPVSKGRAYIVGERRPELFVPNTNGVIVPQVPSMDYSGASVSSGMYGVEVMLKGPDDLLFFVEQAQIRRNIR
jgi:CRP-like cAMP-binding protein